MRLILDTFLALIESYLAVVNLGGSPQVYLNLMIPAI